MWVLKKNDWKHVRVKLLLLLKLRTEWINLTQCQRLEVNLSVSLLLFLQCPSLSLKKHITEYKLIVSFRRASGNNIELDYCMKRYFLYLFSDQYSNSENLLSTEWRGRFFLLVLNAFYSTVLLMNDPYFYAPLNASFECVRSAVFMAFILFLQITFHYTSIPYNSGFLIKLSIHQTATTNIIYHMYEVKFSRQCRNVDSVFTGANRNRNLYCICLCLGFMK